ncbi:DinB family protein [Streptomyces cinnamoneus]|uniref:DinB family protein n=1 Tax=Streptomyces cinnamoneus TaxID=53446 RepID=UPI0037BAD6E0
MEDHSREEHSPERTTAVAGCAAAQLRQVRELVAVLTDAQYVHRPRGSSSIASHVRHCVDHYAAVLAGRDDGTVAYDRRARGSALETDRGVALARLSEVQAQVRALASGALGRPVEVADVVDAHGGVALTRSTMGRELLFASQHAVHHVAVMVPLARTMGVELPAEFGFAPATLAHLRGPRCAVPGS